MGGSPHVLPKLLGARALFSDDTLSLHLLTATEASKHSQVSHEHKPTQVVKLFKSLIVIFLPILFTKRKNKSDTKLYLNFY